MDEQHQHQNNHLTYRQREYLKQLVIECDVQRFTAEESLAYIHAKLKVPIKDREYYRVRSNIRKGVGTRLNRLRKNRLEYIAEFFKRIDEIQKYKREVWATYHLNPDKPIVRVMCMRELHQLTITQANLYEIMPQFTMTSESFIATTKEIDRGAYGPADISDYDEAPQASNAS